MTEQFKAENDAIDDIREQVLKAIQMQQRYVYITLSQINLPSELSIRIANAVRFTMMHRINIIIPAANRYGKSVEVSQCAEHT